MEDRSTLIRSIDPHSLHMDALVVMMAMRATFATAKIREHEFSMTATTHSNILPEREIRHYAHVRQETITIPINTNRQLEDNFMTLLRRIAAFVFCCTLRKCLRLEDGGLIS